MSTGARGRWRAWALGLALGCAACGRDEPPRPYFQLREDIGPCRSFVAVDAQGEVWHAGGCEEHPRYDSAGKVGPERLARLEQTFAALPATPDETCADPLPGVTPERVFVQRVEDERRLEWPVCRDPEGVLLEPYRAVVLALLAAEQEAQR